MSEHAGYRIEWQIDRPISLPERPVLIEDLLAWSIMEDAKMEGGSPADVPARMPLMRHAEDGVSRWMASALHFSDHAQADPDTAFTHSEDGSLNEQVAFVRGWFVGNPEVVERLITRVAHVGDIGEWHLSTHLTTITPDASAWTHWQRQGNAEADVREALEAAMRQALDQESRGPRID